MSEAFELEIVPIPAEGFPKQVQVKVTFTEEFHRRLNKINEALAEFAEMFEGIESTD